MTKEYLPRKGDIVCLDDSSVYVLVADIERPLTNFSVNHFLIFLKELEDVQKIDVVGLSLDRIKVDQEARDRKLKFMIWSEMTEKVKKGSGYIRLSDLDRALVKAFDEADKP
jgi:hypothetical protein